MKSFFKIIFGLFAVLFFFSLIGSIVNSDTDIDVATERQKNIRAVNSVKKLNPYQREALYIKLAKDICKIHKKPGNALYYEKCVKEQYTSNKEHWEAEIKLSNQ